MELVSRVARDKTYQEIRTKETSKKKGTVQFLQDTGLFTRSKYFAKNPDCIPLKIYSDEISLTNPLGKPPLTF